MSEYFGGRKGLLKQLIKRLHQGEDPESIKEEFKKVFGSVSPTEIAMVEEELINEGLPREEVQRLCDVHLQVFRESLKETRYEKGHPVFILQEEHRVLLQLAENLVKELGDIGDLGKLSEEAEKRLEEAAHHFKESEKHYLREENVLFPYLEKHGIKEPPAIMWMEHDKIRPLKKEFLDLLEEKGSLNFPEWISRLGKIAKSIQETLNSHFYKENNILFPMAQKELTPLEWADVRAQFEEIEYCCFTPQVSLEPMEEEKERGEAPSVERGLINFETGSFTLEELECALNTLPVDITFVDKEDQVRYFSQSKDRIFTRTKAVIGRKVQNCHPQKSVHIVEKIVEEFKKGAKDHADFWIHMGERMVYIRYFAVRDKEGKYLGTLEVTQDITDIMKIEGERRLLDW
ncbi:MAG: DUF438 domain-containing protein [Caldiserica bacterium]|nr:DUF438 domain-containing protein [Caldisericota bacterium]MDH7562209.1 DUF438 domain-containing protein [Caldisericota bacterium]